MVVWLEPLACTALMVAGSEPIINLPTRLIVELSESP